MKKIFSTLALFLLLIAFYPNNVKAQTEITSEDPNLSKMMAANKAWYSRCPRGCQWDTQMDCGDRGAYSCSTGNGCGNCH